jgi:hypothetical protein
MSWAKVGLDLVLNGIHYSLSYVDDALSSHPHAYALAVCNGKIRLVVEELANKGIFKDQISLMVIGSPGGKLNKKTVTNSKKHCDQARKVCEKLLDELARIEYSIKD